MTSAYQKKFDAIVIGASTGGFKALAKVLAPLPQDFPLPILVVRHQKADSDDYLIKAMNHECQLQVSFANDGELPKSGQVYIAPPDKHLLINHDGTLSLSSNKPVNYSRPCIDLLFDSAARYYRTKLLAVILTGSNSDGAAGAKVVKQHCGQVLVQDPSSAEAPIMPQAALSTINADYIVWLDQIGPKLWDLTRL